MITRQRCGYWFRLITILVITAFLSQNIGWTAPLLQRETLAPNSGFFTPASRLNLEMAGIGHYLEQEIIRYNRENSPRISSISDLFNKLLKRNKYQILDDLHRYDINTIFYPDRIELISPSFTLVFLNSSQYQGAGFYQIPGTNIRMDLYKHPPALHKSPPALPESPQSMEPHGLTPVVPNVASLWGDIPNALSSPGLHPGRLPPSRGGIKASDSPVKEMIPKLKKLFRRATMGKRYTVSSDSDEMSREAAEYFVNEVNRLIEEKGRAVICLATGDTPREMYRIIREEYRDAVDWSKVIAFHLDEYVFLPKEYPLERCRYSYRYFLQEEIFDYLPIPEENIHFLNETDPLDENYYRDKFMEEVERAGGIDFCILGIGKNGHIAFDEPGSSFDSTIRKVKLKFSTRWANRKTFGKWWQFWSVFKVPRYAFTLGIQEIMASRKIMLLARGKGKKQAVQKSLFGPIIEDVPASILQRHPDVRYFLDKEAFGFKDNIDEVKQIGYRIFMHMPSPGLLKKILNINWWRDKAMYLGMRFSPINPVRSRTHPDVHRDATSNGVKKWLMKKINEYPDMPIYKKIMFFWFGLGIRFIAPRFIAGGTVEKVTENILRLRDKKIDYTVDILGEAVTNEEEAEDNKNKYIGLLEELSDLIGAVNPVRSKTHPDVHQDATSNGVNLSLKLTGLVSNLDKEHKEIVKNRLREILRRAIELDAFITIDMEQYCYKDLTLEIYKEILEEREFEKCDNLQIVLQVYLRDSPQDIEEFTKWANSRYERTGARASVRLVKGAYWDKEAQWAKEDGRPSPVWSEKWQTDKNYEDMTALLLQHHQYIQTVFATHNVRSMARVIYEAQKNKIPKDEIEFQMLYGMGEPFQDALVEMGYRVRAHVPYGPLLKGLKYFSEENTSQESFVLQSLSGRYNPSALLEEPGPSISDYRKRFAQALGKLLKLSPKDFIPDTIKDKLKEFNGGKNPRYYSFNSLDRLKKFCRWGYLWRLIKPDEVIVVRLIIPEKYGERLLIAALRFGDLKEEILKETENVNILEWEKTYFLINRNFNSNDCIIKDEGIYLSENEELREKKLGSSTFRLFIQRLSESGFGGYPYRVQIENPKLLHLVYEELDGRINTTNTGLTAIFIDEFESIGGEPSTSAEVLGSYAGKIKGFKKAPKRKAREFLGFLVNLYRQGVSLDWKKLRTPVEGTIPGVTEPRTPKERFEEMLSSSEMLKKYIEDGRIFELIPEWKNWVKLYNNPNFRNYHHLSPQEHLVLAFNRLESDYFWEVIKRYKLRGAGLAHIRRALFLHDFGKIVALQKDPSYTYVSHAAHPEYSAEMAKRILLRLGYSPEEITDDILLIKHHEVLKNLAQEGEAEIPPLEFVNLLNHPWNLRLLQVLQLVDAASVRHEFENSLSIGLERRINEISNRIGAILVTRGEQKANQERKLLNYLADIKRQNNEIGLAFGKFKEALDRHGIKIDEKILQEAFLAMHRSHLGLPRKDERTPSVIHPIETATILVDELGVKNPNWIIAALLHDVLEDTRTTVGAIELIFGKEVASIVRLLSKPDISRYANKHEQEIDFYHRIIYGADGIEDRDILTAAQTIKIADRINNLRTLTPKIAADQINETYEVFIPCFLGETEVSIDIKRALIRELIRQGKEWKVLTPEQIQELETLSREIIEFKIPELRVEASPYNFIRGLVEYRQQEQPGTPLVLAFNGMSGVGRTTFAAYLQEQLQRVGKKVVVFDANGYLLPRSERDKVLRTAREEGVVFYEQREKLYDIDRFRREVWDRLKGFKESSSPTLKFKLSGLYNRLTGQLDAPNKEYEIDRDTIILIEGIHILQKDFLPLYDATFLVDAPKEVCLQNVLEREKEKPEECRQPPEVLRERFELVDWPSYRKHLLEYWRASGFIIDNTDYRNRLVKKNPFPRYPEKAPSVPKELISAQERLNRNLENIFRQLINKGILPYDIVPGAKNHIDLFRNLLAVKGIDQLLPSIPLPDKRVDTLDYFLDQLSAQTDIVDIFFRLFAIYILEEFGSELESLQYLLQLKQKLVSLSIRNTKDISLFKEAFNIILWHRKLKGAKALSPIICDPLFPQDLLLHILSKTNWGEAKFTPNFILYRSNGLYIEVPRVGRVVIGDQERQFVYKLFVLRTIYGLLNKYNNIGWVRGLRGLLKWLLHYFRPQRIISGEYIKGYRLIMERAPHLITPTRIIEDNNLWEKIRLKGMARQNKVLILQLKEGRLLIDYIHELINRNAWDEVEKTLEKAFNFLEELLQYGLADLDPEVNIWENLIVTENGKIKTCDAESITDNFDEVKDYCESTIKDAVSLLKLINYRGISEALKLLEADTESPNCFTATKDVAVIKTLINRFGEQKTERLLKIFLGILVKRFDSIEIQIGEGHSKSYTGRGGSNKEANPIIKTAFNMLSGKSSLRVNEVTDKKRAIDITDEPITLKAKEILLSDERFAAKDREFVDKSEDKKGFSQLRVIAVPDLPLDGHYGMGGKINKHLLPTVYVPKKLYDYLLKRHNRGDPLSQIELADYLYHKYVEMRLTYPYKTSRKKYSSKLGQAHKLVEHSGDKEIKDGFISENTYSILKDARQRLLDWIIKKQQGKVSNGFLIGIILLISSNVLGMPALILCYFISLKFGFFWIGLGLAIYVLSWIITVLGIILAGPTAIRYIKESSWLRHLRNNRNKSPLACKFPAEEDLILDEKLVIEGFIAAQKGKGPKYYEILGSKELSKHKVFKNVLKLLTDYAPSSHEPIKKALVEGGAVSINSSNFGYREYNGKQVYVRICIVQSDKMARVLFPRTESSFGIPIYPTFTEEDGKTILDLNILSTLLDQSTVTSEVLVGLIVHELSEILLNKSHAEAVLEETPYTQNKIPSRLQWMIDEYGRKAIARKDYAFNLLKQLTETYQFRAAYFGLRLEPWKKIMELSKLVSQRAQMWLDFYSLIRRTERKEQKEINNETKEKLIQNIKDYNSIKGLNTCGVITLGSEGRFKFTIGNKHYVCSTFSHGNETVIIGLIPYEKFGLCLWRFSPSRGTFKVYSLKPVLDNLTTPSEEEQDFGLESLGEDAYIENVFKIREEQETAPPADETGEEEGPLKKVVDPEVEAAFLKVSELITKYSKFLKTGITLPIGEEIPDIIDLKTQTEAILPFTFETTSRNRQIASIENNRLRINIPKEISDKANIGLYWDSNWGLLIWISNIEKNDFVIYRADICLNCLEPGKKDIGFYATQIGRGITLDKALGEARKWMTRWSKEEEEKAREEAKAIIKDYAETARNKGDISKLKDRINEFRGAKFEASIKRDLTITPHTRNNIDFKRLGKRGDLFKMRFILHKHKGLLVVFVCLKDRRRRTVAYSLDQYVEGYDENTQERKRFMLQPIGEGEYYKDVMNKVMISEEELYKRLNKVLAKLGFSSLTTFISSLGEADLAFLSAIRVQLPTLDEILQEAESLGAENEFYISLKALVENLKTITSPSSIWRRQFEVSQGALKLKPGAIIRFDVVEGKGMSFPDINHTISGPATIEFILREPIQLRDLDNKTLKISLEFRNGAETAQKVFLAYIARNSLYLLSPDGRKFTLAELENPDTARGIIEDIMLKSYTGKGGSNAETHPFIEKSFLDKENLHRKISEIIQEITENIGDNPDGTFSNPLRILVLLEKLFLLKGFEPQEEHYRLLLRTLNSMPDVKYISMPYNDLNKYLIELKKVVEQILSSRTETEKEQNIAHFKEMLNNSGPIFSPRIQRELDSDQLELADETLGTSSSRWRESEEADGGHYFQIVIPVIEKQLKSIAPESGVVLDLCGQVVEYLDNKSGEYRWLKIGNTIDTSPTRYGYNWNIDLDDVKELPIESESVDFIQIVGGLHYLRNPVKVLREAYRVLRPGGKIAITSVPKLEIKSRTTKLWHELQERYGWAGCEYYTRNMLLKAGYKGTIKTLMDSYSPYGPDVITVYIEKVDNNIESNQLTPAEDISNTSLVSLAKSILIDDPVFQAKDKEFILKSQDKTGFSEIRVIVVPNLSFDGHYGMGGEVNQHLLPTVYVPQKLYEYLLERHNKGDPLAKIELADYLYHKYVESRLTHLYNLASDQAHQIVDHSDYEKEEDYLAPVTFNELKNARSRLMKWIARNLSKVKITELLTKRQQNEYRKDAKFRKEFEAEIEIQIQQLHELVIPSEATMLGEIADEIKNMSLADLNLTRLYKHLQEISGLDLLDAIEKCAIGSTATHIALLPEVLEKLAHGELDFFKERFVEPNPETEAYLSQMKELFEELAKDKEMLIAFILGFILHDYGLLLMRRGGNSHAVDGEKLLESFLDRLPLTDKQKAIIKILVGEHVKPYAMCKGLITPYNYEHSLGRLEQVGISREMALKMYSLFLFLDTSAGDSEWLRREKWLSNEYVKKMLDITNPENFERFKEDYKRQYLLFREKVGSLIAAQKDLIDLEKPERQQQTRQNIAETLKRFITGTVQDKLTQSMAWHVLEGLGMNEDFNGKVIYSLKALLESDLNDKTKIRNLIESTKGRVLFYTGNGCLDDPDYDFPKDSLVTSDGVTDLRNSGELIVFMLEDEHRKLLGIDGLIPGQLKENQFVIPIGENRDVKNDILLGLEIVRTNGRIDDMPSLFKMLLISAIREWLMANGERPTEERVQEILQIDTTSPTRDYLKDIENSYSIISSA